MAKRIKKESGVVSRIYTDLISVLKKGYKDWEDLSEENRDLVTGYCYRLISCNGVGVMSPLEVVLYSLEHQEETAFQASASPEVYITVLLNMQSGMSSDLVTVIKKNNESNINPRTIIAPHTYINDDTKAN